MVDISHQSLPCPSYNRRFSFNEERTNIVAHISSILACSLSVKSNNWFLTCIQTGLSSLNNSLLFGTVFKFCTFWLKRTTCLKHWVINLFCFIFNHLKVRFFGGLWLMLRVLNWKWSVSSFGSVFSYGHLKLLAGPSVISSLFAEVVNTRFESLWDIATGRFC